MGIESPGGRFEPAWLEHLAPGGLFSVEGRIAVVTGAAGGIGSWLAAGLGLAGAVVIATDRDQDDTEGVVDSLRQVGVQAWPLAIDLMDDEAAARIVDHAVERFGRIDVLVNNAGVNRRVPMLAVTRELFEELWKVDYQRCYELSQAAARVMVAQGTGSIIQISSVNVAVGLEDVSLLGPAKAALSQLTKAMTVEFADHGVRINAIAPGFMATPMNASHWEDPTRAPWIMDRTPMCRPGHPAELVGACLLLASDAGSFITGQTLFVDGGFTAGSRWSWPAGSGFARFQRQRRSVTVPSSVESPSQRPDEEAV